MLDPDDLARVMNGAVVAYGGKKGDLSADMLRIYHATLASFEADELAEALKAHMLDGEHGHRFPTVADLARHARALRAKVAAPYHQRAKLPPAEVILASYADGYGASLARVAADRYREIRDRDGLDAAERWFRAEQARIRRGEQTETERRAAESCQRASAS